MLQSGTKSTSQKWKIDSGFRLLLSFTNNTDRTYWDRCSPPCISRNWMRKKNQCLLSILILTCNCREKQFFIEIYNFQPRPPQLVVTFGNYQSNEKGPTAPANLDISRFMTILFLPAVQHAAGLQALIVSSSPKFKKFDNWLTTWNRDRLQSCRGWNFKQFALWELLV